MINIFLCVKMFMRKHWYNDKLQKWLDCELRMIFAPLSYKLHSFITDCSSQNNTVVCLPVLTLNKNHQEYTISNSLKAGLCILV